MSDASLLRRCAELAEGGQAFVLVTLVEAIGSTPSDTGAKMIITSDGLAQGTVGGGRVEAKAIDHAQAMLESPDAKCESLTWRLKADVGMTCGGSVSLLFEPLGRHAWRIVVFGAGHVTQALARLLVELPCHLTCVDPRADWLARIPACVARIEADPYEDYVPRLPDDAYVLSMTRGHQTDLPVLQAIYASGRRFPLVGVIGSKAKAAVLRKELVEGGVDPDQLDFHCPVGLPIGTNHPGEIAVSIAAQLLQVRDSQVATGSAEG